MDSSLLPRQSRWSNSRRCSADRRRRVQRGLRPRRTGPPGRLDERVGDDPFGAIITRTLARYGVDTSLVEVDQERPTGLYLKDPAPKGTRVYYYRRESAASAIGPRLAELAGARTARLLHLSGITPASPPVAPRSSSGSSSPARARACCLRRQLPSCPMAGRRRCPRAPRPGPRSRPRLRRPRRSGTALAGLHRRPGAGAPARRTAPRRQRRRRGRHLHTGARRVFVPRPASTWWKPSVPETPSRRASSGLLDDRTPEECLRLGHIMAAPTLLSVADLAPFPPREAESVCSPCPRPPGRPLHPRPGPVPPRPVRPLFSGA